MLSNLVFIGDRVRIVAGAATASTIVCNGLGLIQATGQLPIDTDVPAGVSQCAGFRQNATGTLYGTTTTSATDVFLAGLRVTQLGQLVYVDAAGVNAENGVFLDANGALATTAV